MDFSEIFKYLLLFFGGFAAGFINTMAGGGSLLTLPILLFAGLPFAVANGTNRISLLMQSVFGTINFKRKDKLDIKLAIILTIPAIIGAVIGSFIAVDIPDKMFNRIFVGIMVIMLVLILLRPHKYFNFNNKDIDLRKKIILCIMFFFVGLYGGIIQAGIGLVIIIILSLLTDLSLVKINGLKLFIISVYMIFTIIIFALNSKINILYGLIMGSGGAIGAWISSHIAIKRGDKVIKAILVITVIGMALKLVFFS